MRYDTFLIGPERGRGFGWQRTRDYTQAAAAAASFERGNVTLAAANDDRRLAREIHNA
jgi:hypothetical protein